MSKIKAFLLCFVCLASIGTAQTAIKNYSSPYNFIYEDGMKKLPGLEQKINSYYDLFTDVFHFSAGETNTVLAIRVFNTPEAYTAYLLQQTGGIKPESDIVFLRYEDSKLSELVMLSKFTDSNFLIRQLFTHYMYSFLPDVPYWLVSGFSLYFEEGTSDAWLDTAKKLHFNSETYISAKNILAATKDAYEAKAYIPQAWLLVNFLVQSPQKKYNRAFYDGLSDLKKTAKFSVFQNYITSWIGEEQIEKDFTEYIKTWRSVNEDITDGIASYSAKKIPEAVGYFTQALQKEPSNAIAQYYLGLASYSEKKYADAESWYKKALANGSDEALINWALGTSAAADRRFAEARTYLEKAKQLNAEVYGKKVDDLLGKMPR